MRNCALDSGLFNNGIYSTNLNNWLIRQDIEVKNITEANKKACDVLNKGANSIGFISAASSNYFLNRIWTFKSTNPQIIKEYSIFLIISIIGLILNNIIIWLLNDYLFNINFYLSKLFAIGIVYVWNFSMNYFYNFK